MVNYRRRYGSRLPRKQTNFQRLRRAYIHPSQGPLAPPQTPKPNLCRRHGRTYQICASCRPALVAPGNELSMIEVEAASLCASRSREVGFGKPFSTASAPREVGD